MKEPRHKEDVFCFTPKMLYKNSKPSKWNITDKLTYPEHTKTYCGMVLAYFFYLLILDIIENNITFEFPMTGRENAYIFIKCFQDEELERICARGAFEGINLIQSGFKAYQLIYQWTSKGRFLEKPIYISYNIKNWFYSKINSGKQYY